MDAGNDELARARRRFEAERSEGQRELELAQLEFDAASRTIAEVLADWSSRGSVARLALSGGRSFTGLVVGDGPDHVLLDDDDRGAVLIRTDAIVAAEEVRGVVPRASTRRRCSLVGELRTAVAMASQVTVWDVDGPVQFAAVAVADDHLLGRRGATEVLWRLSALDAVSIASGIGPSGPAIA